MGTIKNFKSKKLVVLIVMICMLLTTTVLILSDNKGVTEGGKITINNLSDRQRDTLFKVCKVWGFVKYYHPEVATGKYDWDQELLEIIPKVMYLKRDYKVDKVLYTWINDLGNVKLSDKKSEEENIIKLKPNTEWIRDDKFINKELSDLLVKIEGAERTGSNYYVSFDEYLGYPNFDNEKSYEDMDYTDDGYRLLSLFRYWNIIEYYSPYRELMDEDWNLVLKEFIPLMIEGNDKISHDLTLSQVIARLQDEHGAVLISWDLSMHFGKYVAPLQLRYIEDKLVVVDNFKEQNLNIEVEIGDIILKVDGRDVEELKNDWEKHYPASSYTYPRNELDNLITKSNNEYISLTIERGEKIFETKVKGITHIYEMIKKRTPKKSHEIINGDIGYIFPGSIQENEISSIMDKFQDMKAIIIDLRCYPNEYIVYSVGNRIVPTPTEFVEITTPDPYTPGQFKVGEVFTIGEEDNKDVYKGKIVLLIDEQSMSQPEYTAMAFKVAPEAILIGSPTRGADGNISGIPLVGKAYTYISGLGIYYPDGSQTQRIGIIPDIEVKPTIEGIKEGIDEVLERAIEYINEK